MTRDDEGDELVCVSGGNGAGEREKRWREREREIEGETSERVEWNRNNRNNRRPGRATGCRRQATSYYGLQATDYRLQYNNPLH